MIKYKKGTFVTIPNKQIIKGMPPEVQVVYLWIVDFSDDDGICFPSKKTLSACSGVSIRKVFDCISQLESLGILVKENRKEGKKNLTNVYQIMIIEDEGSAHGAIPSAHGAIGGSAHGAERTQPNIELKSLNSDSDASVADKKENFNLNEIINLFEPLNPNYEEIFKNTTERKSLVFLVDKYGEEKVKDMINQLPTIVSMPYSPIITKPSELKNKLPQLVQFVKKQQNHQKTKSRTVSI